MTEATDRPASRLGSLSLRVMTWVLAAGCFYLVYRRIASGAQAEDLTLLAYLVNFFGDAHWGLWLGLMIPYSVYFFLVDAHATWRAIKWLNTSTIKFGNILPIRASAYVLSLVNEQLGKGAMSLYLLRRHEIPGWQALSTMIFMAMVEIYQLLLFSAVGVIIYYDLIQAASVDHRLLQILIGVYILAFLYLPVHLAYFRGRIFKGVPLRDYPIFHAMRHAEFKHYLLILLCKIPNLLGGVLVYTLALALFSVEVMFGQMLAFLPIIFLAAALPLPFHAGALLLWTVLFPEYPQVGIFSLIMHSFFVLFNACIGLIFLPRANKELFIEGPAKSATG